MVDVEQGSLRPFAEDCFALVEGLVEQERGVGDVWGELLAVADVRVDDGACLQRLLAEDLGQDFVFGADAGPELVAQTRWVAQIHDAHAVAALDFVAVSRADAAASRADGDAVFALFPGLFQDLVVGHYDVGNLAEEEAVGHGKALGLQLGDLIEHDGWIDDHPIAHHADFTLVHDARGNGVEDELRVAGDDCVAGVGPSLIAHHHIGGGREVIDDLGLALVAPLRS